MKEFVQAGKKRPYFTEQEIDEICSTELSGHDLLPAEPSSIRIERLVEKKYGFSCIPGDVPEGVLGFTRFGQNGPEQIITAPRLESDDVVTLRRLRTTLAHEVGHCLLHAHIFVTRKSPKTFCRDTENSTYSGRNRGQPPFRSFTPRISRGVLHLHRIARDAGSTTLL